MSRYDLFGPFRHQLGMGIALVVLLLTVAVHPIGAQEMATPTTGTGSPGEVDDGGPAPHRSGPTSRSPTSAPRPPKCRRS